MTNSEAIRFVAARERAILEGEPVDASSVTGWHEGGAVVSFRDGSAAFLGGGPFPGEMFPESSVLAASAAFRARSGRVA